MMIMRPTAQILPLNSNQKTFTRLQFSNSLSISSSLVQNSSFFLELPNLSTAFKIHNNPAVTKCSSTSQRYSYETVDFERRPVQKWYAIYKEICMFDNSNLDKAATSVLNQIENEGKRISKWELSKVVKELRKFRCYNLALQLNTTIKPHWTTYSTMATIYIKSVETEGGLSYAVVPKVRNNETGQVCARKEFNFLYDEDSRLLAEAEIEMNAALQHPHLVSCVGMTSTPGRIYFYME
ncbi:hypothetical protein OROMI_023035 [Orobanche minor]